jgi:hypothetical protein
VLAFYDEYTAIKNMEVPKEDSASIVIKNEDFKFHCFKDLVDSKLVQM